MELVESGKTIVNGIEYEIYKNKDFYFVDLYYPNTFQPTTIYGSLEKCKEIVKNK